MKTLKILAAERFAHLAHAGQKRKYTGEPYTNHLFEVAGLVRKHCNPMHRTAEDWEIAALLHDVIEDTEYTYADIEGLFGEWVAKRVLELSNEPPQPGLNRAQRKQLDRERLSKCGPATHSIKVADIISNTRDITRHDPDFAQLYMTEVDDLLDVLTFAESSLMEIARKQSDEFWCRNKTTDLVRALRGDDLEGVHVHVRSGVDYARPQLTF